MRSCKKSGGLPKYRWEIRLCFRPSTEQNDFKKELGAFSPVISSWKMHSSSQEQRKTQFSNTNYEKTFEKMMKKGKIKNVIASSLWNIHESIEIWRALRLSEIAQCIKNNLKICLHKRFHTFDCLLLTLYFYISSTALFLLTITQRKCLEQNNGLWGFPFFFILVVFNLMFYFSVCSLGWWHTINYF